MDKDNTHSIVAPPHSEGMRIDVFLASSLPSLTRSRIKSLSEQNLLSVSGVPVKASYRLHSGESISLVVTSPLPSKVEPEEIPLTIVFEDEQLLVLDKPAGIVTHPAYGHPSGTLLNAVLFHCSALAGAGDVLRGGLVHRLDKNTSGLIVFAKSAASQQALSEQFKRREVKKRYLAVVMGSPQTAEGEIDLPIGRNPSERKLMSTRGRRARKALTRWRVLERLPYCSLLEVFIETGRTHQIRVHLSAIGHPVLGDLAYGKVNFAAISDTALRARLKAFPRQALHAASLSFFHPQSSEPLHFSAPLPEDIAILLAFLRKRSLG